MQDVRDRIRPALAVADPKPSYTLAPGMADHPTSSCYLDDAERAAQTPVYEMPADDRLPTDEPRDNATPPPAATAGLRGWPAKLDYPGSTAWVPTTVEVML